MSDRWLEERRERHLLAANIIPTGNNFLDDVWAGGLNKNNLVLAAAKTGVGKTFWGLQLAHAAAKKHKRVKFFALEAENLEIERRQLYTKICGWMHEHYSQLPVPRYREWMHQGFSQEWEAIEVEARKEIELETETLETLYRPGIYTPELFRRDVEEIILGGDEQAVDLIIVDHLHHFFLEGNEIEALKAFIHTIKGLNSRGNVAIVVLAQFRKNDGAGSAERTMPHLEDIRGTAALSDVATDVLLISPVSQKQQSAINFPSNFFNPMFFHLAKCRTVGEAKNYAGIVGFDAKIGRYTDKYLFCKTSQWEDPEPTSEIPRWAKRAASEQKLYAR